MALNKLTVRRLTKLADYMAALPKEAERHFHMRSFAEHNSDDDHKHEFPDVITKKELNFCGTSACALGWATTIPSFRRAGLKLVNEGWGEFNLMLNGEYVDFGWSGFENITQLFPEITPRQANYLFGGNVRVKTPKKWAARCRKFLREHK